MKTNKITLIVAAAIASLTLGFAGCNKGTRSNSDRYSSSTDTTGATTSSYSTTGATSSTASTGATSTTASTDMSGSTSATSSTTPSTK